MEFSKLNIQLKEFGKYYDVIINFDSVYREEFGLDFNITNSKEKKEDLMDYIKKKYPNLNLRFGKIVLGGAVITMFSIANFVSSQGAINIYNVKKGDTLEKIALLNHTTVEELVVNNQLENSNLEIGQAIVIPDSNVSLSKNANFYTVKEGDTLNYIAQIHDLSEKQIIDINKMDTSELFVGQTILIP